MTRSIKGSSAQLSTVRVVELPSRGELCVPTFIVFSFPLLHTKKQQKSALVPRILTEGEY